MKIQYIKSQKCLDIYFKNYTLVLCNTGICLIDTLNYRDVFTIGKIR